MTIRLVFAASIGKFDEAFKEMYRPIAEAAMATMVEAAAIVKKDARADIARAGFSARWQNALRVDVYPTPGRAASARAAVWVRHKIPYAEVFENGATIRGKPLLWLPLKSTPKKIGTRRMTAKLYVQEIGPLRRVNRPGKPPLLVGQARFSAPTISGGQGSRTDLRGRTTVAGPARLDVAALKAGSRKSAAGYRRSIPLFVGISAVTLRKKFNFHKICQNARDQLAELYFKHFKADNGSK